MSTLPRGGISQSPVHAVLQWIWDQSRSNTLAQLQSCAEKEVESIARDNGISASDFRALVSLGPNASDLLERRMALLDLDPVEVSEIAPQTFRDLQQVRSFCQSHRRCRRDLARDPSKPEWKDYCPNVETLMALGKLPWESRREW
jgi:hypothetical protein